MALDAGELASQLPSGASQDAEGCEQPGSPSAAEEQAASPSGEPAEPQQCSFFLRTGTCYYGDRCKFQHPASGKPPVLNSLGYPLRSGEPECPFWLRKGWCAFGHTCKYHHPELPGTMPAAAMAAVAAAGMPQQGAPYLVTSSGPLTSNVVYVPHSYPAVYPVPATFLPMPPVPPAAAAAAAAIAMARPGAAGLVAGVTAPQLPTAADLAAHMGGLTMTMTPAFVPAMAPLMPPALPAVSMGWSLQPEAQQGSTMAIPQQQQQQQQRVGLSPSRDHPRASSSTAHGAHASSSRASPSSRVSPGPPGRDYSARDYHRSSASEFPASQQRYQSPAAAGPSHQQQQQQQRQQQQQQQQRGRLYSHPQDLPQRWQQQHQQQQQEWQARGPQSASGPAGRQQLGQQAAGRRGNDGSGRRGGRR